MQNAETAAAREDAQGKMVKGVKAVTRCAPPTGTLAPKGSRRRDRPRAVVTGAPVSNFAFGSGWDGGEFRRWRILAVGDAVWFGLRETRRAAVQPWAEPLASRCGLSWKLLRQARREQWTVRVGTAKNSVGSVF